ncbi:MAG: hypothetical protein GTO45_24565 [Candidatus Aminicenantes bacterium]|nr:hypothetical protein [Candidatus Aminicenantes bacterium]NIM81928.1 hypothetical protein [Candidatus Aminicenantes bacterium]NIN21305.1 hypothetical protein [Candidatus Aminicenantes bacterium]NIN45126.1 hypothetical protein [Candidatus Aminicenantes bacterium]NIN87943.1 hypothetical protein [Candidatus Aminicenantes bacterium]
MNANVIAHTPASIYGMLFASFPDIDFFIDPQTYIVQFDPIKYYSSEKIKNGTKVTLLKNSVHTLLSEYGEPVSTIINDMERLYPPDLKNSIDELTRNVINFQKYFLVNSYESKKTEDGYDDYSDHEEYEEKIIEPKYLIPPYFFLSLDEEDWLQLNIRSIRKALKLEKPEKIAPEIVMEKQIFFSESHMNDIAKAYNSIDGIETLFIWIDDFDETGVSAGYLKKLIRFLEKFENKKIINLYGGYFSLILCKEGILKGFCHGPGYGEHRGVKPVGGGIPKAQYYLPHLSKRIKFEGFLKSLFGRDWLPGNSSLEDIYTIVDTAILRQRNIGIFDPSALFRIRESLDRLILYIVNKDILPEDIEQYGKKVSKLIGGRNVWNTEFISLNWDYLVERILIDLGYWIDYGIPLERTYTHNKRGPTILVLKPHGSLNWKLCPICEKIYAFMEHENIFQCANCQAIYETKKEIIEVLQTLDVNFNSGLLPLLVSPTFLKVQSVPQLNIIMQEIYFHLSNADELIFIGYSLPISDHDIRELLIKAYSIKPKIKVNVILKSSSDTEKTELTHHYSSIFDDSVLNFHWDGF